MLQVGTHNGYDWLVANKEFDLLQICPEVVAGKYIAITPFDSGSLVPTEREVAAGWQGRGNIAYSPKIQSVDEVPRDCWDEWYIFKSPQGLVRVI